MFFFDKPQPFRNFVSAQLPLLDQKSHMVFTATNRFCGLGDSAVVLVDHGQSAGGLADEGITPATRQLFQATIEPLPDHGFFLSPRGRPTDDGRLAT